MKIITLVALTMLAFAANSVLTRIGVSQFGMDPFVFSIVRVIAGALALAGVVVLRGRKPWIGWSNHTPAAIALGTYMIGFSWAYISLGAGLGALILFGALQIMLFGWAIAKGQAIPLERWIGASLALLGLGVLLWPAGDVTVPVAGTLAMLIATAGWAVYTVLGQSSVDPLVGSAGNFILCIPVVGFGLFAATPGDVQLGGVAAAVAAGALTSGLGYALWYRVLPQIQTTTAATAQLSVPVIAIVAGALLLSEPVSLRMVAASALVLGGIALSNGRWVPRRHN